MACHNVVDCAVPSEIIWRLTWIVVLVQAIDILRDTAAIGCGEETGQKRQKGQIMVFY